VDLELVGPAIVGSGISVWKKLNDNEYLALIYKNNYDFVISCTHSSCITKLRTKLKHSFFIDIEHDLFSNKPEHFKESTVFTTQKKHTDYCKYNSIPFVECMFPKFSATYKKIDLDIDKFNEAIIIGTIAFNQKIKEDSPVIKRGFSKIWYKKYINNWKILKGTTALPEEFTGPLGILNCADNFNFLFTIESSSFVEFILLGKIPILLGKKNKIYGSIFDKIDASHLQPLVKELEHDPKLFIQVNTDMLKHWADTNYFELPSAAEALLTFIKDSK